MFSASGKFSGITGSPSRGGGAAGGYQEEEGRYVPGRLRRRDEPAGEGLFQEEGGCCFQSRPVLGGGDRPTGGRRSQKKRRMFVSGSKEVRQAVHATAVCRGPRQQRGHAAAAVARTVRNLWCSMTNLQKGRRWYGMYICSALSP